MRKCKKCSLEKSDDFFYTWSKKTGATGYRTTCKKCELEINRQYRIDRKNELKIKRRNRTGAEPKKYCTDPIKRKRNEDIYRSQKKYPEKMVARSFLNSYIKMGKVIRPQICEMCSMTCKVEAHHGDYSRPLEVKWVCKKCHTKIHWRS